MRGRLAVIIEDGVVQHVVADKSTLVDIEVVVIEGNRAQKAIRVREDAESEIRRYIADARNKSAVHMLGTTCEVAAEALLELSRRSDMDATAMANQIAEYIDQVRERVDEAVRVLQQPALPPATRTVSDRRARR